MEWICQERKEGLNSTFDGRPLNGGHGKWFRVVMVDGIYLVVAVLVEGNVFLAFES